MLKKTFLEKTQLTKQPTANHLLQQVDVATPEPLSECLPKILRHVRCHIHTNFVSKGGDSHRQTSFSGQLVQLFRRHTLLMKKKNRKKTHARVQAGWTKSSSSLHQRKCISTMGSTGCAPASRLECRFWLILHYKVFPEKNFHATVQDCCVISV